MEEIIALRRFYNASLHKVLIKLDRKRKTMIVLFLLSIFLFIGIGVIVVKTSMPALSLFAWIPLVAYGTFLFARIRKFKAAFKPPVVSLILDFFNKDIKYDMKNKVPKDRFLGSELFVTSAPYYRGEDYFTGKIGNVHFEMSELDVRQPSRVLSEMEQVFRGIFFHANFPEPFKGKILILPREDKQYLMRTIKGITRKGGYQVKAPIEEFEQEFITYANPDVATSNILSQGIFETILKYQKKIDKKIFVAFNESHFYLAIDEPKDILEPNIFRSNVNFHLIRDFYEDISDLMHIVEDFVLYR
ncbi:MAG: DUF3137 domain-containing protein [Bacteroidota bacterium]